MFYKKLTASADGTFIIPVRISGVRLVAGSDAATAVLFDAVTQALGTGRDFCKLSATAATFTDKDIFEGGVSLEKGLSATLTGTNPILYIFYA